MSSLGRGGVGEGTDRQAGRLEKVVGERSVTWMFTSVT